MLGTYRKIHELLDRHERRRGVLLLFLFLVQGILDTVGVASIMPFMAVVGDPQIIETNAYLAYVYERLGVSDYRAFLILLGFVVIVALIGSLAFSAFTHAFLHRFTQMCNHRLSTRLLKSYFRRPYVWFLNNNSVDLGRTVLGEVQQLVGRSILPGLRILSRLVVVVFLLLLVVVSDPLIAISGCLLLAGMYMLIYLGLRPYLARMGEESWQTNENRYRIAQEGLGAIKDVKVSGLESAYLERYQRPARRYAQCHANQAVAAILPKFLMEAIAFGGMLILLVILLTTREQGLGYVLPIISLYAFAAYRLMPALQSIFHDVANVRFGVRYLERLHAELVHTGEPGESSELSRSRCLEDRMELREALKLVGADFTYPGAQEKALDAVNLRIDANTTVGFVGATGAGKTTIVDIILGLLTPDRGKLMVDGEAITHENHRRWQNSLGYVPQQIFLADDTVAANIAFGEPPDRIDMQAVVKAARVAEIHDFVTQHMPMGYDTEVGERGVRLSGGQRQRIGIARALYHDPTVLVLDEATSALDNVTEKVVMAAVNHLGHKKTIIMVAHRLSTVRDCDVIFLMENGRVIANGSYDELARDNAQFRAMAHSGR